MPIVLSSGGQTRTRNCYQPSAQARLSLRTNGEEEGMVISGTSVVFAGFDAPTATPTVATAGAGVVAPGYYVYRYVYASSRYPFVANAITGDGQEWPRSSPSPPSATYFVDPAAESNAVTVTYTTRSDVDWIWLYRTSVQTTAVLAEAQDAAGQLFFVASAVNNTAGGTTAITDNVAAGNGNEPLELDNFTCPLFRYSAFDGFFWWGWGNKTLQVIVLLDDTTTITIDATSPEQAWFSGRDSDPINGAPTSISFYGITTGGYDGRGNYYFRRVTAQTCHIYNAPAMSSPVILPATGTTTAYLTSPTTTLYRSKELNPFSWGITTDVIGGNNRPIPVASLFAEQVGGGVGTAISLIPNERILKLDTEAPERSYALDLNAAESSDFIGTLRTLDDAQSVGSFFSQFPMRLSDGQSVGTGINAKALQILSADAQSQIPIGSNVIATLRNIVRESDAPTFYHGVYDRDSELNCWFFRTTSGPWRCDTLVYQHAPTGTWGKKYVPGVSASWTVFDNATEKFHTFVGTEDGLLGLAFETDWYRDFVSLYFFQPGDVPYNPIGNLTMDLLGEATFTITAINTVFSVDRVSNYLVVVTNFDLNVVVGQVVMVSIVAVGNFIVTVSELTSTTSFKAPNIGVDASFIGEAVVVDPIPYEPVVAWNATTNELYLVKPFGGDPSIDLRYFGLVLNAPTFTWIHADDAAAINLDTGEYVTGIFTALRVYQVYFGCAPAFLSRYFNASQAEKNKRGVEVWNTTLNPDSFAGLYIRFLREYQTSLDSQVAGFIGTMQRDVIGSSGVYGGSAASYYKAVPEVLEHAFGVGFLEFGFLPFTILDMSVKEQPA